MDSCRTHALFWVWIYLCLRKSNEKELNLSYELKEIILKRVVNLEPALQKQAKKLNQKIINTNFYHDAKNLEKIGGVISPELNEFLLSCALEYDKTHADKFDTFDNDVETLRGI